MAFAVLWLLSGILPLQDLDTAKAHRAESFPPGNEPYIYYFTVSHLPEEHQEDALTALRLVLPSLSLEPVVDHQLPQKVEGHDLYWIDIRGGNWQNTFWKALQGYPYSPSKIPLVIRADWFIVRATDCAESTAYYDLLLGGKPKSRDQWLSVLKVDKDPRYSMGLIEGRSGVAIQKKRWLESLGVPRGYAWGTRDSTTLTQDSDPLAHPDGSFRHEAEEWIVGVPKIHTSSGTRGTLQVYLLSTGEGVVQDVAPSDLVTDHTGVRYGGREIRNGISCIACHAEGLNKPTLNEFRSLIESGVDTYAKKDKQYFLEQFHLGDLDREIKRNNEDFDAMVQAICGMPATEAAATFIRAVKRYDAPVTPEQAARDLGLSVESLKLALAYDSDQGYPARLAILAHGSEIPRKSWEEYYIQAYQAALKWKDQ